MNHIKAISGLSPHMGKKEHLSIYIDGKRLDEILSQEVKEDYLIGLIILGLLSFQKRSICHVFLYFLMLIFNIVLQPKEGE